MQLLNYFSLFYASVMSSSQVILICLTGYLSAKYGVITSSVQKGLSELIINVLMPCLFATFGLISGRLLKLSSPDIRFVTTGIIFNSVTTLSLGLLRSMSNTDAIKILSFGENDTTSDIVNRGTSYILLGSLFSPYLLKKGNIDIESSISSNISNIPKFDGISHVAPITETAHLIKYDEFDILGEDAPFVIIPRSMDYIDSSAIPLTLITLGARLKNLPRAKGKEMFLAITFIIFYRFIIMPTIGLIVIFFTKTWYMDDPTLRFVLILIASGPTGVNCMNLAQLCGAFQEEMAALLFYSYIAMAPMITPLIMIILSTCR
ncbi:9941_t:CDS:2 [Diversispora eburnea]|uniref:9941_t:CDS:1 n=1 Tax=Diversispora eburnea TaxID=1213867 RepID=A0A9N8VDW9_9GLOM|nr:9941_t:CDS:2 [Diversispora eburnea]